MKYSIIVILELEEMNEKSIHFIKTLYEIFSNRQEPFEIVIIANGTGVFLRKEIESFMNGCNEISLLEFNTKTTHAVCLKAAIKETTGEIVVVCGAYQQITNNSFSGLLDQIDNETDIIAPWRQHRIDTPLNQFQSKVFNALVSKLSGSGYHDMSCTAKVFRREVLSNVAFYGNMYRFLPILAEKRGFRVKEVKCDHYAQQGKSTFYSLSHYFSIFIDIFTLYFNTQFTRTPFRFFSTIGLLFFFMGVFIALYVFAQKIILGYPIGDRPVLLLAILFMVLGIQAAGSGLLGEIIAFIHGRNLKEYTIEKII